MSSPPLGSPSTSPPDREQIKRILSYPVSPALEYDDKFSEKLNERGRRKGSISKTARSPSSNSTSASSSSSAHGETYQSHDHYTPSVPIPGLLTTAPTPVTAQFSSFESQVIQQPVLSISPPSSIRGESPKKSSSNHAKHLSATMRGLSLIEEKDAKDEADPDLLDVGKGLEISQSMSPKSRQLSLNVSSAEEDDDPSSASDMEIPSSPIASSFRAQSLSNKRLGELKFNKKDFDEETESGHSSRVRVATMEGHHTIKSGYLWKRTEKQNVATRTQRWQKRYFVLRRETIGYYKDEKEYKLLRSIPLNEIHSTATIQVKKQEHTFGIVTPKRTYYCKAKTEQECADWVALIEETRAMLNTPDSVSFVDSISSGAATPKTSAVTRSLSTSVQPGNFPASRQSTIKIDTSIKPERKGLIMSPTDVGAGLFSSSGSKRQSADRSSLVSDFSSGSRQVQDLGMSSTMNPKIVSLPESHHEIEELAIPQEEDQDVVATREPWKRSDSFGRDPSSGSGGESTSGGQFKYLDATYPTFAQSSSDEEEGEEGEGEAFDSYYPEALTPGILASNLLPSTSPPNQMLPHAPPSRKVDTSRGLTGGVQMNSSLNDPRKIIMSGYLMKQGKRKSWRKRWFILMSQGLAYGKSHMDKVHKHIPIDRILDVIEYTPPNRLSGSVSPGLSPSLSPTVEEHGGAFHLPGQNKKNFDHCFKVITPKRNFIVCAPTEEEEIKWLSAIQCLIEARRKLPSLMIGSSSVPPQIKPPSQNQAEGKGFKSNAAVNNASHFLDVGDNELSNMTSGTSATSIDRSNTNSPNSRWAEKEKDSNSLGRSRSATEAVKLNVRDAEKRFFGGHHHHQSKRETIAH